MERPVLFGVMADVAACEERILNCWPSHQTVLVGDWLCRFAQGYSGRANSACAVREAARLEEAEIQHIEGLYRGAGQRPSFRLSPLTGEALRERLETRGYRPEDGSFGMIGPAFSGDLPSELLLEERPAAQRRGQRDGSLRTRRCAAALDGHQQRARRHARLQLLDQRALLRVELVERG